MKKIFAAALLMTGLQGMAQSIGSGVGNSQPPSRRMEVYSWATRPDEDETNLQKKFINQEWTNGNVKFRSGRPDMQVPLLFDVHNDIAYYLQDSVIMEFVDSVSELHFITRFNKDTVHMLFRRFYPAIQANSSATFYQVLVNAGISLLKCSSKSILLFKDPDIPEEKRKDPAFMYFASLPGNKIVAVAPDADLLMKRMPEYSNAISAIMKREKIKPKDENRLIELFIHLNNEMQ
jgi:hypothetical protein